MLIKFLFTNSIKLGKPAFGKAPEGLYSVYMTQRICKLIGAVMDAKMFVIANIYQSVIASPTIGVNNAFRINFAPYNTLKRLFTSIWNNLGIDFSVSFKDAKNDGFTRCTPASFTMIYPL
jgi:hypothetical protein